MFWRAYYRLALFLRPLAMIGLRVFSKLTNTKRARVVMIHNDKLLLVQDIFSDGRWSLPGGGVNRGEDAAVAASRELREEVGVEVDPSLLTDLGSVERHTVDEQPYMTVLFSYYPKNIPDLKVQKWEIVEAEWFLLSDLPESRSSMIDESLRLRQS